MALLKHAALAGVVALLVVDCASPGLKEAYGEGALRTERFDMLDSAVMLHPGAAVSVLTQSDVGAIQPTSPSRTEHLTFSGDLMPPTSEYLRLLHGIDTLRIGKGNVTEIYLRSGRREASTAGVILGALAFGGGAAVISSDAGNTSSGTKLAVIPVAALLGALIGAMVVPQEERGERIYPPLPPPRPGASK